MSSTNFRSTLTHLCKLRCWYFFFFFFLSIFYPPADLKESGQADNTIVVFTSDHGEMLGERGMWFKKTFFEPAMRIPLLVHAPSLYQAQRVATPVSLVDLLPTFCSMAQGSQWSSSVEPLDGENMMAFCTHPEPNRAVYAEYLSETTPAPIFMIRRGNLKFISSTAEDDLLFDLTDDKQELVNKAGDAGYADTVENFLNEIKTHWDEPQLTKDILLSQARRQLLISSVNKGVAPRWDHQEQPGQDVLWYRGEEGYNQWAYRYLSAGNTRAESKNN